MDEHDPKLVALAALLNCDSDEIEPSTFEENVYEYGSSEYLVLTDSEADEAAEEEIEQSLFAFRSEWLLSYVPTGMTAEALSAISEKLCEDASPTIRAMIGERWDEFVADSIGVDGRGHFLNHWDGEEEEAGEFYVYRVN